MSTLEIIKKRRSVKEYLDKEVPSEIIEKIVEAGIWAPSACNVQGWHFLVINDKKGLQDLTKQGVVHLSNVPVGIFVLYDKRLVNKEYQDHFQSAAAAIQNMHLMAFELGLGSCWVCDLPKRNKLKKMLGAPWYFEIIALFTLGYPKSYPPVVKRKGNLKEFISYNKFEFKRKIWKEVKNGAFNKLTTNRLARKTLNFFPSSCRKYLKQKLF